MSRVSQDLETPVKRPRHEKNMLFPVKTHLLTLCITRFDNVCSQVESGIFTGFPSLPILESSQLLFVPGLCKANNPLPLHYLLRTNATMLKEIPWKSQLIVRFPIWLPAGSICTYVECTRPAGHQTTKSRPSLLKLLGYGTPRVDLILTQTPMLKS